jgi:hypothetical protein
MPDIEIGISTFGAQVVIVLARPAPLARPIVNRVSPGVGRQETKSIREPSFDTHLKGVVIGTSGLFEKVYRCKVRIRVDTADRLIEVSKTSGLDRLVAYLGNLGQNS